MGTHPPNIADTVILPTLLNKTGAQIDEVYADAGYLSSSNAQAIRARGAVPFIKPKKNTVGRSPPRAKDKPAQRTSEAFREMVDRHQNEPIKWQLKYGKRNGIEATWSAVKRRFASGVAALSSRMRRIEAALKLIAWNLTRVTRP